MTTPFQTLAIAEVTQQMFDSALRVIANKFQGYDIKPVWPSRTIIANKPGIVPDVHPHIFILMDGKYYVLDVSGKGNPKDYAIALDITTSKVIDTSDIEDATIIEEEPKQVISKVNGKKVVKSESEQDTLSPMVKQYYDLKSKNQDRLLIFRVGDFYHTYGEDARTAAEVLGITLTKSSKTKDKDGKPLCMAGFPCHALDTYLPKLIRSNHKVAICDQLEDPKMKKTIKRGITEVVETKPATVPEASPSVEQEYDVDVVETLVRTVRIKAKSKEEAERIAENMYANSEIVLTGDDRVDSTTFDCTGLAEPEPPTPNENETSDTDDTDLDLD